MNPVDINAKYYSDSKNTIFGDSVNHIKIQRSYPMNK